MQWIVDTHDQVYWYWKLYDNARTKVLVDFDFGFKTQEEAIASLDRRLKELGHDRA